MKTGRLGPRDLRLEIPAAGFPKREPSARLGTSTPPPGAPAEPLHRSASPDTAARAPMQAETLDFLGRHPDVGELHMWDTGALPLFPTGKRPPNHMETVALRDFAQRVNQHRHSKVKGAFVPNRVNREDPLTKGEYTASYHGPKHPAERIFRSNFDYAAGTSSSTLCNPDTKLMIHSHPLPVGSTVAGETQDYEFRNRIRVPSMVDHFCAAEARVRSGADNYLVFGSQVFHYTGKDLSVTELVPSPLTGRLPQGPPPEAAPA